MPQKSARVLKNHPELRARLNEPLVDYGAGMPAMLAAVQRSDRKTVDVLLQAGRRHQRQKPLVGRRRRRSR